MAVAAKWPISRARRRSPVACAGAGKIPGRGVIDRDCLPSIPSLARPIPVGKNRALARDHKPPPPSG